MFSKINYYSKQAKIDILDRKMECPFIAQTWDLRPHIFHRGCWSLDRVGTAFFSLALYSIFEKPFRWES